MQAHTGILRGGLSPFTAPMQCLLPRPGERPQAQLHSLLLQEALRVPATSRAADIPPPTPLTLCRLQRSTLELLTQLPSCVAPSPAGRSHSHLKPRYLPPAPPSSLLPSWLPSRRPGQTLTLTPKASSSQMVTELR